MKRINLAIAVMALCAPLSAQNINQSVQVTNDYVSRFSDFQKTTTGLQVPDSLYRFDYAFDYSVFETPYKGSYEFSPYRIAVTPEARLYDGSKFFLRAGAGYSIHPQFEMAWQMFQSQDFAIGVFAEAGGYAGKYSRRGVADPFSGHDLSGRVGLGGQYLRPATRLSYHFGYEGIFAGEGGAEPYFRSGFSSVIAAGRIQSRERPGNQMFYDIDVQYRYSSDEGRVQGEARASGENNLRVALSAGPVLASKYRILVDGIFELELLRGEDFLSGSALHGEMFGGRRMACLGTIKPHVDFLLGPVRLDAGVRVDYTKGTEQGAFTVSPDVTARMALLDADMELTASVSGGQYIQSHYAVKQINHFAFLKGSSAKISREKLHVRAGVQGHVRSRLQYEIQAGYVSYLGMPLASLYGVEPVDYDSAYIQGRFSWRGPRLELDLTGGYSYLRLYGNSAAYAPPAATGELRGRYNWDNRFWLGLFVEAQSSRLSLAGDRVWMPWFVNPGLTLEYQASARWSFWAEAGNLLGMAIERAPGFVEKGQYGTVGFSLKL